MISDDMSSTGRTSILYTDGGCHNTDVSGKLGIGSFAFLEPADLSNKFVDVYGEYVTDTTNNRTEMLAIINGIKFIDDNTPEIRTSVHVVSDSGYVVKGYTDPAYLDRWTSNGWKTSNKKPVQNRNLWEQLLGISWHVGITFELIRGHKKDKNHIHAFWNDICDKVCTFIMDNKTDEGIMYHFRYYFENKSIEEVIL